MLQRFFLVSLQHQQLREALVCRNELRSNPHSALESRCGVSIAVLRSVDAAEIITRLRSVWRQFNRASQRLHGLLQAPLFGERNTKVKMSSADRGIQRDSLTEISHSSLEIAALREQLAVIGASFSIVGIDRHGALEILLREIKLPLSGV